MSTIDTRAPFFPNAKPPRPEIASTQGNPRPEISSTQGAQSLKRNSYQRAQELNDIAQRDAKVTIPESVKDFSRIKKAVDAAPEMDNSAKIADLKARIQAGTYAPDYDAIADKLLASEY